MSPRVVVLGLALGFFWGCSSGSGDGTGPGLGGSGGSGGSGGGTGGGASNCEARMAWLQKDAYKDTAGRNSELWPPHTTTTLTLSCDGTVARGAFQANHGTEPDAKDSTGTLILEEVHSQVVTGSAEELHTLMDAYEQCECGTKFLSLDALEDSAVQLLVQEIESYLLAHLTCSATGGTQGLVDLLKQGNIEGVLGELPGCTWASGQSWSDGFDTALTSVIAQAQETLAEYHVCNNDAKLQAQLVASFAATGTVTPCDGASSLCSGPAWYYSPSSD